MTPSIKGLVPILATPFCADGSLDVRSLQSLVEFQLGAGVDGVAVFGMASEGFALTEAERERILREVTGVVSGAVTIVAGVNATSTATAQEQADRACAGGAEALMVLPPFMVRPPASLLVDFYHDVAASAGAPVMIQDAPGVTGVAMSVRLIADLSAIANVNSVKVEAPPTVAKVGAVRDAVEDPGFAILGGMNAQFCLEEHDLGAVGTMPACEFSDLLAQILQDWTQGDKESARLGFRRLLPMINFGLQPGIAWAVHKEILVARGIIEDAAVRYPAMPLDGHTRRMLASLLGDMHASLGLAK